jgi:hypothetical protein
MLLQLISIVYLITYLPKMLHSPRYPGSQVADNLSNAKFGFVVL